MLRQCQTAWSLLAIRIIDKFLRPCQCKSSMLCWSCNRPCMLLNLCHNFYIRRFHIHYIHPRFLPLQENITSPIKQLDGDNPIRHKLVSQLWQEPTLLISIWTFFELSQLQAYAAEQLLWTPLKILTAVLLVSRLVISKTFNINELQMCWLKWYPCFGMLFVVCLGVKWRKMAFLLFCR